MKPVFQDSHFDPIRGEGGNCFAAVIASIFEIPLEDVLIPPPPHPDTHENHLRWWADVRSFLRSKFGCGLVWVEPCDAPRDQYLPGVVSNPIKNCKHAVVVFNGEVVHDPSPGSITTADELEMVGLLPLLDS